MSRNAEVSHIAEIRRHAATGLSSDADTIETEPESPGSRGVYVLIRGNNGAAESPTFSIGEQDSEEAVPMFSARESAILFLQVARWDHYRIHLVSPLNLNNLVAHFAQEGIRYVMIDPNRHDQERGVPQPVLDLENIRHLSGEELFEEIRATGKNRS